MNIGKLTAIIALTAGIGAAAPALAASGPDDTTGLTSIGIDITTAGTSPTAVQQFLAGLAPDTQRSVLAGCETAVNNAYAYAPNVVVFCETATGGGAPAASSFMGFMPDEPAIAPDAMSGVGAY